MVDPNEIERYFNLAPDDPERLKFEENPENAALLLLHDRFLDPQEPNGARPDEAEAFMREFIARQPLAPDQAESRSFSWRDRLGHMFNPRVLTPIAAVMVVAVAITAWQSNPTQNPVLRNLDDDRSLVVAEPEPLTGGGYTLSWQAVPDADQYVVRLLSADLNEIRRLGPMVGISMAVTEADLNKSGDVRFWQVVALRSGDEFIRSSIQLLD
jgi:hypothetical protein